MYTHQISSSQEFPPNVLPGGIPFGVKNVASTPFRFISLSDAEKGIFTVLYNNGGKIKAREIPNYDTEKVRDNDLWQFIQVDWSSGSPFGVVLLKHIISGNYLCLPNGYSEPICTSYDSYPPDRYNWNLQDRTIFFIDPGQKYFVYQITNDAIVSLTPMSVKDWKKNPVKNADINYNLPIGGKPYIRLLGNKSVKMSYVQSKYYSENLPLFHPFWSQTVWNVGKGINDIENEWYPILQRGTDISHLCLPPTSEPMGLGLLKNWKPGGRYADKFNRCNVPLQRRFTDRNTQTKPEQTSYPKIMFGYTSDAQERYTQTRGNGFRENIEYWQYMDIMMFISYSQGWPPPSLKFLKVPTGLGIEANVGETLFDALDGFIAQQGAGIFAMPPKSYVESAHKNGCKVFSVLFFQQNFFGGKWSWWANFLKDRKLFAHKLVDFADYYGIDGYFVNFEAEFPGDEKVTEGTDCSKFTNACDHGDCSGYWCNYTVGGIQNCTGKSCSIGKWTSDGNVGFDGSDINKEYFIEFLKEVRSYREVKGVNCEICAYASMGPNGDSHNYTSGITDYFKDFWFDEKTGEPVVDAMLSMPPGGQNNPQHIDYTYSHSREAVTGCVEDFEMTEGLSGMTGMTGGPNNPGNPNPTNPKHTNVKKIERRSGRIKTSQNTSSSYSSEYGWPLNTGPSVNGQPLSSDLSCGFDATNCSITPENRTAGCVGNDNSKESCEAAGCCYDNSNDPSRGPWCFVKGGETPICPDGDWTSCGGVDKQQALIPKDRPLDFYIGTTAEKGFPGTNVWTYGYTDPGNPEPWDKYIYCGTFDNCDNYKEALTKPLSSFFLWQANLNVSHMGADIGRTQKMNKELYESLYAGKTGLVNKNFGMDPYTNVIDMGISNYVCEKTTLDKLPFHTSFCTGNGDNFYIDGIPQLYFGSWTDNIQDYLPTWRWWSKQMTLKNASGRYIESMILSLDYTRSWNGGSCLKVDSVSEMGPTEFYLYKTKFSTNTRLSLKVVASALFNCTNMIKIGYTLGSQGALVNNPQIYYFDLGHITSDWKHYNFTVESKQGDYISSIVLYCNKPMMKPYTVYLGSISITPENYHLPHYPSISSLKTTQVGKLYNYNISWKQIPGVLYYNVFLGDYYMGRIYGSGCDYVKADKCHYNVSNMVKNNNSFRVEAVTTNGTKLSSSQSSAFCKVLFLMILIGIIFSGTYKVYNKRDVISDSTYSTHSFPSFLLLGISGLLILTLLYKLFTMRFTLTNKISPGNMGLLTQESGLTIENWPHCKKKAFNINFDDNRPKSWTWLLEHMSSNNIPAKVTFFINTLWLDRDLEKYKSWQKKYNVDYGAHGHWHMNHTQDNVPTPPGVSCFGSNQSDGCCVTGSEKYCVTDEGLAENDIASAKYIREKLYDGKDVDLIFAFPYGALPFNNDGTPKEKTMAMLQKEFIAARHVTWGQVLQYPDVNDPDSLLGGCADYQGQPAGCDNACSVDACSPYSLTNIYDTNMTKYAGPEYSWPGGIDLNLDPGCENCDIVRQMDIRKQSLIGLLESEKPYCIMVWGHDFHPTTKDGITVPCDKTFTEGECTDQSCKNNAQLMAQETGSKLWLSAKGEYNCPTDVAKELSSCSQSCVRGAVKDGVCTDTDIFKNAYENPTAYYKSEAFLPKNHPDNCSECADSCWNPSIGKKLLELLDLLKGRDDIWFGHFVEIVQYLYNRKYSKLEFVGTDKDKTIYHLTSSRKMKDFPLTISFPYKVKGNIKVDGKTYDVKHSKYSDKYYFEFTPKKNLHVISVSYI